MERGGGRPKDLDIWKHVTVMEGKRVKCNYCGLVFAASANRIKSHINQIKGNGIRLCSGFPQPNNIGSNKRVNSDPKENLIDSQGLSKLDSPRDCNKLNETMLNCYMSPKTMWEGIMAHRQVQNNTETKNHNRIRVGPFFVSNVVNEHDLQLIQYVFEYSRETYMVFSSSRSFLKQSEFTTLKPETLLDSLVIDIFAEILTDIERKKKTMPLNWYLPVTFSNAALSGDVSSFLDFVERHNMRENYMSDLVYCEKMFIPVHIGKNSHGHFYLYIVHLKNQEVEIWDSLPYQFINKKEYDETTQKLLLALDELCVDGMRGISWTFAKFHLRMANNIPLQPNGYDCGIFVINFMQQSTNYVKSNPLFQFDSDEERLDLALKLLKSNLNKERTTLYNKAAKRHYAQGGNEDMDFSADVRRGYIGAMSFLQQQVDVLQAQLALVRAELDQIKTLQTQFISTSSSPRQPQCGNKDDSDLSGIKRKAYIELDDSDRRVKCNVGLEKGENEDSERGIIPKPVPLKQLGTPPKLTELYRGVKQRHWGEWFAEIQLPENRTELFLGIFDTAEKAAIAHDNAAHRLWGEFARLNFPHLRHQGAHVFGEFGDYKPLHSSVDATLQVICESLAASSRKHGDTEKPGTVVDTKPRIQGVTRDYNTVYKLGSSSLSDGFYAGSSSSLSEISNLDLSDCHETETIRFGELSFPGD